MPCGQQLSRLALSSRATLCLLSSFDSRVWAQRSSNSSVAPFSPLQKASPATHRPRKVNHSSLSFSFLLFFCSFFFASNQSFLVRAIEQVDVNKDLARQCRLELQKVLKSLPAASHALLFVGTKLLATFAKPDFAELLPQDVSR